MASVLECGLQVEERSFLEGVQREGGASPHKASFKKAERLQKRKEFEEVYKKGHRIKGKCLWLYLLRGKKERKVGIVVEKRIKKAVLRNRIKRLLRENWRLNKERMEPSFHLVISARKGAEQLNFWQMREEFLRLLDEGGLLRE
jgi:ribonuclease P protein component